MCVCFFLSSPYFRAFLRDSCWDFSRYPREKRLFIVVFAAVAAWFCTPYLDLRCIYTMHTHTHTLTLFMIHSGEMLFKLRAVSSPSRQECEKERQDPREEEEKDGKSTFKRRNIYFVWCLLIIIA